MYFLVKIKICSQKKVALSFKNCQKARRLAKWVKNLPNGFQFCQNILNRVAKNVIKVALSFKNCQKDRRWLGKLPNGFQFCQSYTQQILLARVLKIAKNIEELQKGNKSRQEFKNLPN